MTLSQRISRLEETAASDSGMPLAIFVSVDSSGSDEKPEEQYLSAWVQGHGSVKPQPDESNSDFVQRVAQLRGVPHDDAMRTIVIPPEEGFTA